MTRRGRPIYLVTINEGTCLQHQRLVYIRNARILRIAKLVDRIKLNIQEENDSAEVLIGSDSFNASEDKEAVTNKITATTTTIRQTTETNKPNIIDKLYIPCIESKSTRVVRQNKSITAITKKFKGVYANIWELHDLSF